MIQHHTQRLTLTLFLGISLFGVGIAPHLGYAVPFIWETDFGTELTQLTGEDDETVYVSLDFDFDFFGIDYRNIFISTNGHINLGGDVATAYNPNGAADFINALSPMIAPFWSDMDLTNGGKVFFNQSEDRAVITWDGIGSFLATDASFTFQAQLIAEGRVIFGYNGVADTVSNLDEDLVIGLSRGFGTGEAVRKNYTESPLYRPDLSTSAYEVTAAGTVYEVFDEGSKEFDLVFTLFLGKIDVDTVAEAAADAFQPPPAIPEPSAFILLLIGTLVILGYGLRRREHR